jgi:hypothetical protein
MNYRTRIAPLALLAVAGLATLTMPAWAQDQQQPERHAQKRERPMLSGPSVREQRVPGTESGFSAGAESMSPRKANAVPAEVFRKALAGLMAEDAPLEIRLSPEQRERISAHVRAMRGNTPEFPQRGPGGGPAAERGGPGGEQRARGPARDGARQRPAVEGERPQLPGPGMEQDRSGRPPADRPGAERGGDARGPGREAGRQNAGRALAELQHRIWAELSAAQQAHVTKVIEEWQAKSAQERMGQMQERYRKEIGARFDEMQGDQPRRGQPGQAAGGGDRSPVREWFSSLPRETQRQVRERLGSMPAERREALIARVAEMTPEQRAGLVRRLLQSGGGEPESKQPQ